MTRLDGQDIKEKVFNTYFSILGVNMRSLQRCEIDQVQGGQVLSEAEATNAYMMAGSMFFPIIGNAIFKTILPTVANTSLLGALAEATIVCGGTGIGVWVGYQVYYAVYDPAIT